MNRRRWLVLLLVLGLAYGVALVPESVALPPEVTTASTPFRWDADEFWTGLERKFEATRAAGCDASRVAIVRDLERLEQIMAEIAAQAGDSEAAGGLDPSAPILDEWEATLFQVGPGVAACSEHLPRFTASIGASRALVKRLSIGWPIDAIEARERLYRWLYGGRAALEEAMLQAPSALVPSVVHGVDEPSRTPSSEVAGVRVHSGDLLLSRGGAPTSALIARGNDFPGNFSHVALVYVAEDGAEPVAVEAHIEGGVKIATVDEYLADRKLRIVLLRPRADHARLLADPMLPHRAARYAFERASNERIPYDFEMDFSDPSKLFCSEVASEAYATQSMSLWMGLSHISSPVVQAWLSGFGVTHFVTQAPSDLEYDPQLRVVAEWRDADVLFDDHLDSAIIDALVEHAREPAPLPHSPWMLPLGRALKAWSAVQNAFGYEGVVPDGMSATAALRNRSFSARHAAIKKRLVVSVADFERQHGYRPPYWALERLAGELLGEAAPGE